MKRDNKEYRTLKIVCEKDKYEIIMRAIEKFRIREHQPSMSTARAIELMLVNETL